VTFIEAFELKVWTQDSRKLSEAIIRKLAQHDGVFAEIAG
jgi:hypothetical protein